MLTKKVKCTNCGFEYDEAQSHCLQCGEENNQRKKKYKTKFPWFPISIQITFALIGIIGFVLISLIVGVILAFTGLQDTNKTLYLTLYNSITYAILFIIFLILIIIYRQYLKHYFKRIENYIFGIVFGIALIGLSLLVSYIVGLFHEGTGGNQSAVIQMVKGYPVLSIIILVFVGPICEEITYRLGLFTVLARKSKILAYVITILIFSLVHLKLISNSANILDELWSIPSYVLGATMLTITYDKFGFEGSVLAHIVNNLYSVICIMLVG